MSNEYAYGSEEIVYAAAEDTFGVLKYPTGADAIKVLKCDLGFSQERGDIFEKGDSRSLVNRVTRRKNADWSIEKYLLPSGDDETPTPPDDDLLWQAVFGDVDETGMIYSLAAEPAISLSICRFIGPHLETVFGAVPSKWGLKFGGGDEPKVTFSGQAADHWLGGVDAIDTLASDATSTNEIVVNDASLYQVGMAVTVGDDDNGGDGFIILEIDLDTETLTLDDPVTDEDTGAAVIPLALTPETAGTVIPVIIGSVTIGETPIYLTGASFDLDQKVKLRNDEFGYSTARGYRHPERRTVTCSLDLYFEKGAAAWLNDAKRFTSQALTAVLGSATGSICTIAAGQVEFDIPKVAVPDADEATITLSGTCLGDDGEDEIMVTFS